LFHRLKTVNIVVSSLKTGNIVVSQVKDW
jgi:hypothetical protein